MPQHDFGDFEDQRENLDRVRGKIGRAVLGFCAARVGGTFHADDLHRFVTESVGRFVAPASSDRILRDLRQRKWIDYENTNRAGSLYLVRGVKEERCTGSRSAP